MTEAPFTHDHLKHILVERIGLSEAEVPDELTPTFTELGLDSLAIVELQLSLQQDYGVSIPDENAHAMGTLREAIDYVNYQRFSPEVV
jgi:acyl carrier protein